MAIKNYNSHVSSAAAAGGTCSTMDGCSRRDRAVCLLPLDSFFGVCLLVFSLRCKRFPCLVQLEQLQALQPLAEDPAAAAQDATEADEHAMAARAEQQRTVSSCALRRPAGRVAEGPEASVAMAESWEGRQSSSARW